MNKVTENVYAMLRRRIMAGYYAPGMQLKEEHIAEEMAISRTPVRSALHRLAGDGLVNMAARRGAFVAEWTKWDVAEIFALRCLLEPYGAGLAARHASDEEIRQLHALTDRKESLNSRSGQGAIAGIQKANHDFHTLMLRAARSPRLAKICEDLIGLPMLIGSFYFRSRQEILRSVQQHKDIILAIEARDELFAEQAMSVHLRASHRIFVLHRQAWAEKSIPSGNRPEAFGARTRMQDWEEQFSRLEEDAPPGRSGVAIASWTAAGRSNGRASRGHRT
jgi:DNA-binding GntR family transcriptional regulator